MDSSVFDQSSVHINNERRYFSAKPECMNACESAQWLHVAGPVLLAAPCPLLSSPQDCTHYIRTVSNRNLTSSFELYVPARQSTAMNALSIETASEAERNMEASGDSISAHSFSIRQPADGIARN